MKLPEPRTATIYKDEGQWPHVKSTTYAKEAQLDETTFIHETLKAKRYIDLWERPYYWAGYSRGLRRQYDGENFGTDEEHQLWLYAAGSEDEEHQQQLQGYRDGYNFQPAESELDSD